MRIAFSGTHRSGKSTLLEEVSGALPKYATVDEPYHVMAEDGYEFADPPSLEDFEAQLEHSIDALQGGEPNVLFDRCPLDFLAYIQALPDADAFDQEEWLDAIREAVESLDLIVFVPIEARDRVPHDGDHDHALRRKADEALRDMLVEDSLGLGASVLEVQGSVAQRAKMVLDHIRGPRR